MSASAFTAGSIVVVVVVDVVDVDVDEDEAVTVGTGADESGGLTVVVPLVVFGLDEAELHAAAHTSSMTVPAAYFARRAIASWFLAMGLLAVALDLRSIRPLQRKTLRHERH
jgi:hypothetical protein